MTDYENLKLKYNELLDSNMKLNSKYMDLTRITKLCYENLTISVFQYDFYEKLKYEIYKFEKNEEYKEYHDLNDKINEVRKKFRKIHYHDVIDNKLSNLHIIDLRLNNIIELIGKNKLHDFYKLYDLFEPKFKIYKRHMINETIINYKEKSNTDDLSDAIDLNLHDIMRNYLNDVDSSLLEKFF